MTSVGKAVRRRVCSTFSFTKGVRAQLDAYVDALEARGVNASLLRGPLGKPIFSLAAGNSQQEGGQ